MGTRQSGIPAFRIANIVRDQKILEIARAEADYFLNERKHTRETDQLIHHARSQPRYGLANVG
jgi:ATP-dependent DNA helicase RecG